VSVENYDVVVNKKSVYIFDKVQKDSYRTFELSWRASSRAPYLRTSSTLSASTLHKKNDANRVTTFQVALVFAVD
jgi:hypothetical protein